MIKHPKPSSIRIDTDSYYASHGISPKGNELWIFDIAGAQCGYAGMYSDAKKKAIKQAKAIGENSITVLPLPGLPLRRSLREAC